MTLDFALAALFVIAAAAYLVIHFIRKSRKLSQNIGPCGHCCDNCPFAKYNQGVACCSSQKR